MSNRPDSFMPLWIGDYLADTTHLTTEQHGVCLLLLMEKHRTGCLPANDVSLAIVARLPTAKWKRMRGVILETINRLSAKRVAKKGAAQ